ncbi:hypothetical protein KIW84_070768 [Lathyrus oleraceus]|uniref:Mandelate racemase/muconate lactonizing enzyme C-terminal domain-containing protein n=1 Tax=Pisum sativum TaxID=3888 RepID=A0A9D4VHM8_PEA|nr:hypothetical protein KIW84_070768 [Pisum sativum]
MEDGSVGFGEVAPLQIHKENLVDAEYQLRFLIHAMKQVDISSFLSLLKGSFSYWIWNELGILPSSIFPSVRCHLEMAILNAIADSKGSNLLDVLNPSTNVNSKCEKSSEVPICALLDSNKSASEVANVVAALVKEGFSVIKLKVARGRDPVQDATLIQEVRKKVGCQIIIRVDANRNWTFEEAMKFGSLAKDCNLQCIEEPVQDEDDILKFYEESGLPVALDETVDKIQENPLKKLLKVTHPGIVAVVIKPSVVGGFENAGLIAQWVHQHGKMVVVSSAFESSLSLSAYTQFSSYLEVQRLSTFKLLDFKAAPSVAHGLGTYRWLKEDITLDPLLIGRNPRSGLVEASVENASRLLHNFQVNQNVICNIIAEEKVCRYQLDVEHYSLSCSFEVYWITIMKTFSESAKCISIDLPGHGKSVLHGVERVAEEPWLSLEIVGDILHKVIHHVAPAKVTLVGYSMGARIALYMALKFLEIFLLLFKSDIGCPEKSATQGVSQAVNISWLVHSHPVLNPTVLMTEANMTLGISFKLLQCAGNLPGCLTITVLNCLAVIARKRPQHHDTIDKPPNNISKDLKKSTSVVQFDTTQNRFLVAGEDGQVKFWDVDSINPLTSTDADGGLQGLPRLKFNKEGNILAVTTMDGGFKMLANATGLRSLRTIETPAFEALRPPIESAAIKPPQPEIQAGVSSCHNNTI